MTLLVVEDDKSIAQGLLYALESEGYEVILRDSVSGALSILGKQEISLALLDIGLPDGSGYDLCRQLKQKQDTPVIFLTACDDEVNVVMGLDMGGDDYITKPFRIRELLSRIKTVLRRYGKTAREKTVYHFGDIRLLTKEAKVLKGDQEVFLSALEYRLFLVLASHEGQVLTRKQLLESIWDVAGNYVNDNTLTVYIKRLREKLEEDPANPRLIQTVRGLGYKVDANVEK